VTVSCKPGSRCAQVKRVFLGVVVVNAFVSVVVKSFSRERRDVRLDCGG
jgi:hypothetical protein